MRFKKIWENKKITLTLCTVLILGVVLGIGAKIIIVNAALDEIEFKDGGSGEILMKGGVIKNLGLGSESTNAANIGYVNGVANGTEPGIGIWQSPVDDINAYLRIDYANLGIGTTAPAQKLEVLDDVNHADNVARLRITDIHQNPELQLQYGTGNNHWGIYNKDDDGLGSINSLRIWNNTVGDAIIISQTGDVNIVGDLMVVSDAFQVGSLFSTTGDISVGGGITANGQICDVNGCIGDGGGADGYLPNDPATSNIDLNGNNIKLNGGYISNDGNDEGISIDQDGRVCANEDCKRYWGEPRPPRGGKIVFVSETTDNGCVSPSPDTICQNEADSYGLSGTYKAWIAAPGLGHPYSDFTHYSVPIYQFNFDFQTIMGPWEKVADNWNDLTNGDIDTQIDRGLDGTLYSNVNIWSNVDTDGTIKEESPFTPGSYKHCSNFNWCGGQSGNIGKTAYADSRWTVGNTMLCSSSAHFYCFEQ